MSTKLGLKHCGIHSINDDLELNLAYFMALLSLITQVSVKPKVIAVDFLANIVG